MSLHCAISTRARLKLIYFAPLFWGFGELILSDGVRLKIQRANKMDKQQKPAS
jgi:hypothetical protein